MLRLWVSQINQTRYIIFLFNTLASESAIFLNFNWWHFAGDNVDCWMEIQQGKGPWASPVTGIVPLGTTLTMVVGIDDKEGNFYENFGIWEAEVFTSLQQYHLQTITIILPARDSSLKSKLVNFWVPLTRTIDSESPKNVLS